MPICNIATYEYVCIRDLEPDLDSEGIERAKAIATLRHQRRGQRDKLWFVFESEGSKKKKKRTTRKKSWVNC